MIDAELGGFQEPRPPFNATQIFAGPNDGLSQTYNGVPTFVGLQGRSQKAGYRVIYPTLDMGRYLEIAEADILETEELSPDHSPFGALGGTRVSVREAAPIFASRAVSPTPEVDDEFDLDIRLGASGWSAPLYAPGYEGEARQAKPIVTNGECPTQVCHTQVTCVTCKATCHTCPGEATCVTCETCATKCATCVTCQGEATCVTCKGEATCATCAGEATCATCKGEATCATCETKCAQHTCGVTCVTCATCHTCVEGGCPPHTQTCCKTTCF